MKQTLRQKAANILEAKGMQTPESLSSQEISTLLYELQVHQIELEMQNEELVAYQKALHEERTRYFDLYDLAPIGYCTLSENGLILEANLTASTLLATTRESLITQPFTHFIVPEDQDIYYHYRKKFLHMKEMLSCELRILRRDEQALWVSLSTSKTQKEDEPPLFRLLISDISERKNLEKSLVQKDKMLLIQSRQAAMGDMLSMIAHQWRQPLNIIAMEVNNLKIDKELGKELSPEMIDSMCDKISKTIQHLSSTVDDFRGFFKPDKARSLCTMNGVIEEALSLIGKSLENHAIKVSIDNKSTRELNLYSNELLQVFINLITNAQDALLEAHTKEAQLNISIIEDATSVHVNFCNNHGSIAKDIFYQLGEPYVSSKNKNGTGLGIYMSKIIITKHLGGKLHWKNQGDGACFSVSLPLD
jgi:PAS domain S-box-containing protein